MKQVGNIPQHTSLYLDLLRFGASLIVFIFHMGYLSGTRVPIVGSYGSEAVLAFFVLSGLVIANTAQTKHRDAMDFFISRLARLWSVVLPALILTLVLDLVGQHLDVSAYSPLLPLSPFKWVALLGISVVFANQIWSFSFWPGTNGAYWSLSYEFWYYCMFAAAFYGRGVRRFLLTLFAAAIAGPKIVIALPVWLMGVAANSALGMQSNAHKFAGMAVWIGSFALIAAYIFFGVTDALGGDFPAAAKYASVTWDVDFWPKSYVLSVLIAANIIGFNFGGSFLLPILRGLKYFIRAGANISFGLYAVHYPVGYFFRAIGMSLGLSHGVIFTALVYGGSFLTSVSFAYLCEGQKRNFKVAIACAAALVSRKIKLVRSRPGEAVEPVVT